MENKRVYELFERYHKGIATPSETEELMGVLKTLPDEDLAEILLKKWTDQNSNEIFFTSDIRKKFLNRLQPAEEPGAEVHHLAVIRKGFFLRIAAVAAILLILSSAIFFLWRKDSREIAQTTKQRPWVNDIAPGGDRAILTLANGRQILLDTASDGYIVLQDGVKAMKKSGQLSYAPSAEGKPMKVLYNTVTTPKGGQYQVELPDGSQVWLNAASSLYFPTAFTGKERKVEVDGEAYFEVAKNKNRPFVVSVHGAEVQVLGTHFNVMAYRDETAVKTTLLEGSVKFATGNTDVLLHPGQQSQLSNKGEIKVVSGIDVENVIAWKNGMFSFHGASLETVMRQFSRWYDVEVIFKSKKVFDPLTVEVPRYTKLTDALKALELSGSARFEIEGKRIVVKQ